MVDFSILSTELQPVDPALFPSIDSVSPTQGGGDHHDRNGMDSCRCRDQVNWTPELWWLLNWWTWQFPPPDLNGLNEAGICAGLYVLDRVQIESASTNELALGTPPTLSTIVDGEEQTRTPPMQIDAVHRTINMGNGLIDLFA